MQDVSGQKMGGWRSESVEGWKQEVLLIP